MEIFKTEQVSGSGSGLNNKLDTDPVCPGRLDPDPVCPGRLDPDPVCLERLDPDPVNIRPDPKPCYSLTENLDT